MSHHIKPSSVDSYLSGICSQLEPFYPSVRDERASKLVSQTLKGCKRLYNTPTTRRQPLLPEHLIRVGDNITRSSPHGDVLFATLLFTGFHGLLRLGEMTVNDNPRKRNTRKLSVRNSLHLIDDTTFSFVLTTHKADTTYEGNIILIKPLIPTLQPLDYLSRYITSRDRSFPLHPQLWLTSQGLSPTRTWFMKCLRGFQPDNLIAGQSMRAGGATLLATQGALPSTIQAAGRWSSNAFQIYIRKNPFLLHAILRSGHHVH